MVGTKFKRSSLYWPGVLRLGAKARLVCTSLGSIEEREILYALVALGALGVAPLLCIADEELSVLFLSFLATSLLL